MNDDEMGRIGEYYTLYKLASLRIRSMKVSEHFDFDLLTVNGIRIEVKSARKTLKYKKYKNDKYSWYSWAFTNTDTKYSIIKGGIKLRRWKKVDRKCDFFVCVCMNEDYSINKCYIIPKKEIGMKCGISIGETRKGKHDKWLEKWDLLK